jgi:hypothetical protein
MTAIGLLKRVYLKFHCGEDRPDDYRLMSNINDYLCNELGDDEVEKWIRKEIPDYDSEFGGLGQFWKPEA